MLKNYIKIIRRNLARNRFYAFINIIGLAIGISATTLIALYVEDELSYDEHHKNKERIYRLTSILDFNGEMDVALTNYAAGPTLQRDYPEVESYVRFYGGAQELELEINEVIYNQDQIYFTDSTLFDVFTYDLITGNPSTALVNPFSIVLTRSLAEKYYGSVDIVGEELRMNNSFLTVTAVIEDLPQNSEINARGFVSISSMPAGFHQVFEQDWFRISFYTYLLMSEPISPLAFEPKLDELNENYVKPWSAANGLDSEHDYMITPLADVHFDTGHDFDLPKGNTSHIYIFVVLAVFLLLIASFNYINLTLAQQSKRAKEVGIRKTLGATKKALIIQFLMESLLFTAFAIVLGLALTELFLGQFNAISGKEISSGDLLTPAIVLIELGVLLFLGVLAGAYPAFVFSSLKPVTVLSGGTSRSAGIGFFRKSLIMLQFLFSIFMIAGTFLIDDQMTYMREMNLGFDRENLVSVNLPSDTTALRTISPWIEELETNANVLGSSRTSLPTGSTGELMFRVEENGEMIESTVKCLFVDETFIEVLDLDLVQGRNFSPDFQTDQASAFIVNETAAQVFGWGDEPLNKRVQWGLEDNGQAQFDGNVIGMVNDFIFLSLHNPLEPLILCYNPNGGRDLSIRLASGDYTKTLEGLEASWNQMLPGQAFNYSFYDDDLQRNYEEEVKMYSVFTYFSIVSILLACLGLFALLSYSIQSRAKEIGIRKVLGANLGQLSWIIVKDFFILMCIAFVVAAPLVYLLWLRWLEDFAFQTDLNVWSLVVSFLFTLGLSAIAVAYHSWRISKSNPIIALREE